MSLSQPIMRVMCACESAFSQATWSNMQVLRIGTLLARGRRTVTAARRQMGVHEASNFRLSHHVRNRARWSALELSRRVVWRLVRTFVAGGGELTCVIDETLERRWGRRIHKRGHDRDPLASSTQRSVATSGLRWIVLTLVSTPPWTPRPWALPVLRVPAPTPEVSRRLGRAASDGTATSPPDDAGGAPLVAWDGADAHRRPTLQRPRTGPGVCALGGAIGGPAADGCRLVWACGAAPAGHQRAAAGERRALAAAGAGASGGPDALAAPTRALG